MRIGLSLSALWCPCRKSRRKDVIHIDTKTSTLVSPSFAPAPTKRASEVIYEQIYQKIDQADGFEKAISEKLKKQISIRKEQRISCSIGIVLAEDIHGEEEINQMIKRADDLLYSIKTTTKGTYRI